MRSFPSCASCVLEWLWDLSSTGCISTKALSANGGLRRELSASFERKWLPTLRLVRRFGPCRRPLLAEQPLRRTDLHRTARLWVRLTKIGTILVSKRIICLPQPLDSHGRRVDQVATTPMTGIPSMALSKRKRVSTRQQKSSPSTNVPRAPSRKKRSTYALVLTARHPSRRVEVTSRGPLATRQRPQQSTRSLTMMHQTMLKTLVPADQRMSNLQLAQLVPRAF